MAEVLFNDKQFEHFPSRMEVDHQFIELAAKIQEQFELIGKLQKEVNAFIETHNANTRKTNSALCEFAETIFLLKSEIDEMKGLPGE